MKEHRLFTASVALLVLLSGAAAPVSADRGDRDRDRSREKSERSSDRDRDRGRVIERRDTRVIEKSREKSSER